jgi:hypothetical protein
MILRVIQVSLQVRIMHMNIETSSNNYSKYNNNHSLLNQSSHQVMGQVTTQEWEI